MGIKEGRGLGVKGVRSLSADDWDALTPEEQLEVMNAEPGLLQAALKGEEVDFKLAPEKPSSPVKDALAGILAEEGANAAWNSSAMQSIMGSGPVATAEANAAWNAAGMGGEVLPEVGVQSDLMGFLSNPAVRIGGGVLGAAGLYNLGQGWGKGGSSGRGALQGALSGAGIGNAFVPGIGAAVGAPLGAAFGFLGSVVKAGKHKDQKARDSIRSALQNMGVIDEGHNLSLGDGSKFNIGVDGGSRPYNFQSKDEMTHQSLGWAIPLARIATGGDAKLSSDFAGYFANAGVSNAKDVEGVRGNMNAILRSMNLDSDRASQILQDLKNKGKITDEEYRSSIYGLGTLSSGKYRTDEWQRFNAQPQGVKAPTGQDIDPGRYPQRPREKEPSRAPKGR